LAQEVDAVLVLCAVNMVVSMPAMSKTDFNHLEIVSRETALKGFWTLKNNCEVPNRLDLVLVK
jgi:hypothetical protein